METLHCSHQSCSCSVSSYGDFCGTSCRDQAMMERTQDSEGELACGCGHSACFRQADFSLRDGIEEEIES